MVTSKHTTVHKYPNVNQGGNGNEYNSFILMLSTEITYIHQLAKIKCTHLCILYAHYLHDVICTFL